MRIALLDDEKKENENLCALIESYAVQRNYDIVCEKFTSGRELLKRDRFDLYFLDYVMDEMNGVDVGRALYEKFSGAVTVCYLTGMEAAASEVINAEISAVGFLTKPVNTELLYQKLDRFYRAAFGGRLQLKKGHAVETVYAQEIIYAEAADKQTRVRFRLGEETYRHSFSEMERLLSAYPSFFRIHRSYIVNMLHVKAYDVKSVMMVNGDVLPLKSKDFAKVYRDFIFNEIR
ncbi:MAG: LytTR family DNA-binding domain-containing protein [Clostridia bacterium]|nr:LytTR family DNA-binding domain-containing protein [Clostridia bacterium]